ncbi:MAG TPA: acyltransferase [Acidobacteriaceae bacterium]|jgi:peptidoglycan/LPS O-acetylase OafA/YrhL|nr:acyltransferase [Acidobacteriaceae bacterium]
MNNQQATAAFTSPLPAAGRARMPHLPVLDGWRGISILSVLAAHMLPLGPKHLQLNDSAACFGMAIFFTLSGFLITSTLYFHPSVRDFFIRRACRILPAAWLFMVIVLAYIHATPAVWRANMLFYANLPPYYLPDITAHMWSLCVEVQFYLGIGIVFLLLRRKGLALLPFICVAVTVGRVFHGATVDIATPYRIDEILSGTSLAYLFHGKLSASLKRALSRISPFVMLALLCASCLVALPHLIWLNYLRPYCAAALVGTTLFHEGTGWNRMLESRSLKYIASISYALYVWHPLATVGWFAQGSKLMKYAKRPIGFALAFALAHVSTFYFEKYWIKLGKRLTTRKPSRRLAS